MHHRWAILLCLIGVTGCPNDAPEASEPIREVEPLTPLAKSMQPIHDSILEDVTPFTYESHLKETRLEPQGDAVTLTLRWDFPVQYLWVSKPSASMDDLPGHVPQGDEDRSAWGMWDDVDEDCRVWTATLRPESERWYIKLGHLYGNGIMQPSKILYFDGHRLQRVSASAGTYRVSPEGVTIPEEVDRQTPTPMYDVSYTRGAAGFIADSDGNLRELPITTKPYFIVKGGVPLRSATVQWQSLDDYLAGAAFPEKAYESRPHDSNLYRDWLHSVLIQDDDTARLIENGGVVRVCVVSREGKSLEPIEFFISSTKGMVALQGAATSRELIDRADKPFWLVERH